MVGVLAGTAAIWAWYFVRAGSPAWALAGVLAAPVLHGAVLAIEFALAARVNRDPSAPRAGTSTWLVAWFQEWLLASRVFAWRQPFRSRSIPDQLPSGPSAPPTDHAAARALSFGDGVLLVHGYLCNRGMWNPWMARLRSLGVPYVAVDLEPVFGSIDDYAPALEAAVQRLFTATGRPVLVVAHSMGGLAVRAWLDGQRGGVGGAPRTAAAHSDPLRRVRHVFTIGSPHRGTFLARFSRSASARQMRLDGDWHRGLAEREPPELARCFTCFYSRCDNVVFPALTATLPGADNRPVQGCGHLKMIDRPELFDELRRWLTNGDAAAADDPPKQSLNRR